MRVKFRKGILLREIKLGQRDELNPKKDDIIKKSAYQLRCA